MIRAYVLVIWFLFIQSLFAQDFEVVVSENKIGLNQSFEISFILNDSGRDFSPPPFYDFQILRGPSKSSSTSIVNGNLSQETSYTYILKPKKIGVFTILPASIKVKGKTIGTQPITIQVKKGSVSTKSNTPYDMVARKVHLEVKSNKNSCYVGEPIVLTYNLYFNLNIGNVSQNPIEYTGFWVNDIDVNSATKKTEYRGERYNFATIKQVVLVPQKPGKQVIDQLNLDLVASVPTGKRDFFNMTMTQQVDYSVLSNILTIEVLDLPKVGVPNNFSGAIGDFKLNVMLDKDSIGINESATFSVKISGSGNLTLINTPRISFNDEIEVFDPKNSDNIKISNRGIKGYKKEEYLIVPRYKGVYNLNPVEFNFFNPKTKKYVSLKSKIKTIEVTGGQQSEDSYTLESISKEKIDLINEDIKFIKTNRTIVALQNNFSRSSFFYVLICLGVGVLIFSILYKKQHINFNLFFHKNTFKETLEKLKLSHELLANKEYDKFQSRLLELLLFYVSKNFSITKSNLSMENINRVLIHRGVPKDLIAEYVYLLEYLEKCKYSPHQELEINKDLYARSVSVVKKINEII